MSLDLIMQAYLLAREKHAGQFYGDEPYINHCVRVAAYVPPLPSLVISALLHDTVEDTDLTLAEIERRFGFHVWETVGILTRNKSLPYMEYIMRVGYHSKATLVKLADLHDHLTNGTPDRLASLRGRYLQAQRYLLERAYK